MDVLEDVYSCLLTIVGLHGRFHLWSVLLLVCWRRDMREHRRWRLRDVVPQDLVIPSIGPPRALLAIQREAIFPETHVRPAVPQVVQLVKLSEIDLLKNGISWLVDYVVRPPDSEGKAGKYSPVRRTISLARRPKRRKASCTLHFPVLDCTTMSEEDSDSFTITSPMRRMPETPVVATPHRGPSSPPPSSPSSLCTFERNMCYIPLRLFLDDWELRQGYGGEAYKNLLEQLVQGELLVTHLTDDQIHNVSLASAQLNLAQLISLRSLQVSFNKNRQGVTALLKKIDEYIFESLTIFLIRAQELQIQQHAFYSNTKSLFDDDKFETPVRPAIDAERKALLRGEIPSIFRFKAKEREQSSGKSAQVIALIKEQRENPSSGQPFRNLLQGIELKKAPVRRQVLKVPQAKCEEPPSIDIMTWSKNERLQMGKQLVLSLGAIYSSQELRYKVAWWLIISPEAAAPVAVARLRTDKDTGNIVNEIRGVFVHIPSLAAQVTRPKGERVHTLQRSPGRGDTWQVVAIDHDGDIRLLQPPQFGSILNELRNRFGKR